MGSPRSGTSILTWCLGQHSNIFVQEESDWIGPFAYQLDLAYRRGSARGERSQLTALGICREEFFVHFGQCITELILAHRQTLQAMVIARRRQAPQKAEKRAGNPAFQINRSQGDPKRRWVDGTPEYSLYIPPLRMLFPDARFIHLVRDVTAVVRSMLNFERTGGPALVADEQQAYEYWLKTTLACFKAERAYGSNVLLRVRHSDLTTQPEMTMRRLLAFLEEPFEPACLEPLRQRINSSAVPAEFDPSDPRTDPERIDEAKRLEAELMADPTPLPPDPAVAGELEAAFQERSKYLANLEAELGRLRAELEQVRSARSMSTLDRSSS